MKIAIISTHQHTVMGGTETYHRNLFNLLGKEHSFVEFPIFFSKLNDHILEPIKGFKIDNSLNCNKAKMISKSTYKNKVMKKIYSDFDIVIYGNAFLPKKWINNSKTIIVQHFDKDFYNLKPFGFWFKVGHRLASALFGIQGKGNPFIKANNSVFFCDETKLETKGNSFVAPLPFLPKKEINSTKPKIGKGIWYARIDEVSKGVIPLTKIVNANNNIDIYGYGPDEELLLKNLNDKNNFKGKIEYKDIIKKISEYKFSILTSYSEGFAFTLVESLSLGKPVVAFDTFESLNFFKKSGAVFLLESGDIEGFAAKCKELEEMDSRNYSDLSKKAIDFAKENLSLESFKKAWVNILKSVVK